MVFRMQLPFSPMLGTTDIAIGVGETDCTTAEEDDDDWGWSCGGDKIGEGNISKDSCLEEIEYGAEDRCCLE